MPIASVNSTQIFYKAIGSGYPILFLHGMAASHRLWEPQEEAFSSRYSMIIPDLRGHGQSGDFVFSGFNLELMADDMKHLLDTLQVSKAHVVGVSMGAMVSLIFAVKYPQYVNRLVVADGYSAFPTKGSKIAVKMLRNILKLLPWNAIEKLVLSIYDDEKRNERYTKQVLHNSYAVSKEDFVQMKISALPNMTAELRKISATTLVMGGDGIEYEVIGARNIKEHIPTSSIAIFEEMFDPLNVMGKDMFNEMVIDFLEGRELKRYDGVRYSI